MNKKGDEAEPRTGIIVAIIAAFVLVIVILGVVNYWPEITSLFRFLPDFNQTTIKTESDELKVKFEIRTQNVFYYDGFEWIKLDDGSEVEVGEFKIKVSEIKNKFIKHYWNDFFLTTRSQIMSYEGKNFECYAYYAENGIVRFGLQEVGKSKREYDIYGGGGPHYRYDLVTNSIEFCEVKGIIFKTLVCEPIVVGGPAAICLSEFVDVVRDYSLKKPLTLEFLNLNNQKELKKFCINKGSVGDLIIDLKKPRDNKDC
ncbi:MAG: hypothetical protein N3D20_01440 [Candidatus Pacearchaeota archaeon]|nr:hypothetical protein [Candidatus Pacearchaeota archaeon]